MKKKELLLGIDMGTSGCKVTLIDTDCNYVRLFQSLCKLRKLM